MGRLHGFIRSVNCVFIRKYSDNGYKKYVTQSEKRNFQKSHSTSSKTRKSYKLHFFLNKKYIYLFIFKKRVQK